MIVSRRTLLTGLGVGIVAAASGCAVSDPRVSEPTGPRWTPTPSPTPAQLAEVPLAAQREADLAAAATALVALAEPDNQTFLQAAAASHQAHHDLLMTEFGPAGSTPGPTPSPAPAADLATGLQQWQQQLTATANEHRSQALLASGPLGLVFASCATFANVVAIRALRLTGAIGDLAATDFASISDTDALAQLVTQLHAARFAYQTALGRFQLSDDRRQPLEDREAALTSLRDLVTESLVARGVAAPAAEPAYEIGRPTDPAAAIALTAGVEQRLMPFVGAAVLGLPAEDALRPGMVDQLTATATRAIDAGGSLPRWPGIT